MRPVQSTDEQALGEFLVQLSLTAARLRLFADAVSLRAAEHFPTSPEGVEIEFPTANWRLAQQRLGGWRVGAGRP